jgi:serine/threonine-protein kinase
MPPDPNDNRPEPGDEYAPTVTPAAAASVEDVDLGDMSFEVRYAAGAELGRGGMGEVLLCRDARIGRDVAMKVMRPALGDRDDIRARFMREARVQGQLEHPVIVPVYDLGALPTGAPYFTMKRLHGRTLGAIIAALRSGDAHVGEHYSRRKLLSELSNLCLAVEMAHTRGVLHRDLKPQNIMFGDFGEVYLLDWGLAKIAGVADTHTSAGAVAAPPDSVTDTPAGSGAKTEAGSVLGTPGYMAPEQLSGRVDDLDARADVYSMGCILFEVLALEPLHDLSTRESATASTLGGIDARPSVRAPDRDIPPELDALCERATALDPADRFASVRELHDALERFLDGDRDLELRRELAAAHAAGAAAAARKALAGDDDARREATQLAGRALALDPEHAGAGHTLMELMLHPPRQLPAEVERELAREAISESQQEGRLGASSYLAVLVFTPLLMWAGLRDWWILGALIATCLLLAGWAYFYGRTATPKGWHLTFALLANTLALALLSRMFGPYVIVPGLACGSAVMFSIHQRDRMWVPLVLASCAAGVLLPLAGEWLGVLQSSYAFEGGAMIVLPNLIELPETAVHALLTLATVGIIAMPTLLISLLRRELLRVRRDLHVQRWQLGQLVPERARAAATSSGG